MRRKSGAGGDPDSEYPNVDVLSSARWGFSHALADVGLIVFAAGCLLLLAGANGEVRHKILELLPAPVQAFWRSQTSEPVQVIPAVEPQTMKKLGKILPEPGRTGSRPAARRFGVGSTAEEVRAIQGAPSSESEGVWTYGKSEVRFVNGRVVSWRSDPADPLRAE
ncbi:MAG: hypothetical protein ACM336_10625 [Acidobacteriota bacterium]